MANKSKYTKKPVQQTTRFEDASALLTRLLEFQLAADATVSSFFHMHPQLGKFDRAFVAATVYFILRHFRSLELAMQPALAQIGRLRPLPKDYVLAAYTLTMSAEPSPQMDRALQPYQDWVRRTILPRLESDQTTLADLFAKQIWPPAMTTVDAAHLDLPEWLYQSLLQHHATDEVTALSAALAQPATFDLRVNTLNISRQECQNALAAAGIDATPTPYSPYGLRVSGHPAIAQLPLFVNGSIEVQDEGSQLICCLLAPRRGEAVFDFCAGAGGKTLMLGQLMHNSGRLYAAEVSAKRLARFKPRMARSGLSNIQPLPLENEHDKRLKRLHGKMDRVLVDAPCSGTGTLRRNPDLKWRRTPTDVAELCDKQLRILQSAAKLVKAGGRLVYATCSLLPEENQAIAAQFLQLSTEFSLVPANELLTKMLPNPPAEQGDYLQLLPHLHGSDGFFAAVFERCV